MDQYAVLSDIHANIWALEAVLADIARRGLDQIINLGDTLYGPLEPQATAECLMKVPLVSIQGNQDRQLLEQPISPVSPIQAYVRKDLSSRSLDWLAAQPATRFVAGSLFLCHGTPLSDQAYLLETMTPAGGFLQEPAAIQAQLTEVRQARAPVRPQSYSPHPSIARRPPDCQSRQRWAAGLFG